MASNLELALLTQVSQTGDFHTLEKARIDESYFFNDVAKAVFNYLKYIYHHPQTVGHVPSLEMIHQHYPGFYPVQATDTVPVLVHELRRAKVRTDLLVLAQTLQMKADSDPLAAIADLRAESSRISSLSEVGEDLSMSGAFQMLLEQYNTVQTSGGLLGIPYPWGALNEETQGMQNGQFIVIYGRPKSMKSWIGIDIGVDAYIHSRRRVLFYTREMSIKMVAQRVASRICRVDYKAFKNGTLQPHLKQQVFETLQDLIEDEKNAGASGKHQPWFIVTSDRAASAAGASGGVGWLQAKIRELKPDLVIVDGMYLMKDDRTNQRSVDWKQIAHISQDLKLTAQEFDIPLVGITQANRSAQKSKGEDLTELAFSDAIGQDADAVFRVSKKEVIDETNGVSSTQLYITAPGLREGKFEGIVIHGQPGNNFDFIRRMVPADHHEAEEYGKKGGMNGKGAPKEQSASFSRPSFMTPRGVVGPVNGG